MNNIDFKTLAKTISDELLFDIICHQKVSRQELDIYMEEVRERGIEEGLSNVVIKREERKIKVKASLAELSKESLFNIVLFNVDQYQEDDLINFKTEIERRGLDKELSETILLKELDDMTFKSSITENSNSPEELLNNFNEHTLSDAPETTQKTERKQGSLISIMLGVVLISSGLSLTFIIESTVVFYGAIFTGGFLLIRGLFNKTQ